MSASEIVNKVWNYAHVLRDDGVGHGDYFEAALAHLGNCSITYIPVGEDGMLGTIFRKAQNIVMQTILGLPPPSWNA